MTDAAVVDPPWVRGIDRLTVAGARVAAVGTALMALQVIADVVGRFAFQRPLPGTLELVAFGWMPIIVFLALAEAQRKGEHLRVTLFVEKLPDGGRRLADAVGLLVAGLVLAALLLFTTVTGVHSVAIAEIKPAVIEVPIWPFRLVAVAGLALLLLQTVVGLWRIAGGGRIADPADPGLPAPDASRAGDPR